MFSEFWFYLFVSQLGGEIRKAPYKWHCFIFGLVSSIPENIIVETIQTGTLIKTHRKISRVARKWARNCYQTTNIYWKVNHKQKWLYWVLTRGIRLLEQLLLCIRIALEQGPGGEIPGSANFLDFCTLQESCFLGSVVILTGFVSLMSEWTFIIQVAKICTRTLRKYVQNIQWTARKQRKGTDWKT
jgi:hypothetical protein